MKLLRGYNFKGPWNINLLNLFLSIRGRENDRKDSDEEQEIMI